MSNQPDPVIQNIVDWCQEDNIPCTVANNPEPPFAWVVTLGRVGQIITIYKTTNHNDRIYVQSQIAFSEAHRTLVNQTWNAQQRNNMMFNLTKLAVQYGVGLNFQQNADEIIGVNTFKIHHHSTISKAELLEKYIRIESIHMVFLNQLNLELGVALQQNRENESSGNADTGR